ncbi:RDD family protein [Bacillus sp. EAC]|uniref:RDD family protein n=1 Tax=Bacillus sp. EAC TaxID=1978338 RepID=UPI000B449587|nr:RDD family protein [Bacillus sp. EAC]
METNDLASRSSRFLAVLIDFIILVVLFVVIVIITSIAKSTSFTGVLEKDSSLSFLLSSFIVGIIYNIIIPSFVWNGQTIGKRWVKIAVVTQDGEKVNWKTMTVRSIFTLLGQIKIPVLSSIIGIIAFIDPFFIFNEKRRTLHDMLAKTKVIDV